MNNKIEKLVIVIPIYKRLTELDILSLESLNKLELIHIKFIGNYSVFIDNRKVIMSVLKSQYIAFVHFRSSCFESVKGYNRLLLSNAFYQKFKEYYYVLLVQLDALIINNQITCFLARDYSYIGAPWFKRTVGTEGLYFGNGGLSLRKVKDFITITRQTSIIPSFIWKQYYTGRVSQKWFKRIVFRLLEFLVPLFKFDLTFEYGRLYFQNEDFIFSKFFVKNKHKYNLPLMDDVLSFSFDTEPRKCFELNSYKLPFGCHGWYKNDKIFWEEKLPWLSN